MGISSTKRGSGGQGWASGMAARNVPSPADLAWGSSASPRAGQSEKAWGAPQSFGFGGYRPSPTMPGFIAAGARKLAQYPGLAATRQAWVNSQPAQQPGPMQPRAPALPPVNSNPPGASRGIAAGPQGEAAANQQPAPLEPARAPVPSYPGQEGFGGVWRGMGATPADRPSPSPQPPLAPSGGRLAGGLSAADIIQGWRRMSMAEGLSREGPHASIEQMYGQTPPAAQPRPLQPQPIAQAPVAPAGAPSGAFTGDEISNWKRRAPLNPAMALFDTRTAEGRAGYLAAKTNWERYRQWLASGGTAPSPTLGTR